MDLGVLRRTIGLDDPIVDPILLAKTPNVRVREVGVGLIHHLDRYLSVDCQSLVANVEAESL